MMKDLVSIEKKPIIPQDWSYQDSVQKVKQAIFKWKSLSVEMANELWIARDLLSQVGRNWNKSSNKTWSDYCLEIGSQRQVVNRWLRDWFLPTGSPEQITTKIHKPVKGKYQTIVIDPPWPMEKILRDVAPNQYGFDYPTMSLEEIQDWKPLLDLADDDCHLWLWTTQKFLPASFEVLNAWGFNYIFTSVWHKNGGFQPFNLPQYNCEFILYGRKGTPEFTSTKNFNTCFNAPRREHSRKPDEFYELVRRVCPEPRLDVFSREKREGFEQYGNEVDKFNE